MKREEYTNPICIVKEATSVFVWAWYEKKIREAINKIADTPGQINSLSTTFTRYQNGVRLRTSLARLHISLRNVLLDILPIENTKHFFQGSFEEQETEALATAARMMDTFEIEHARQKKSLETA